MSKTYKLEPELSKSSIEIEEYSKHIDDKFVTISISTLFRWSEFEVNLNNEQKENLLKLESLCIDENLDYEFVSSIDGISNDVEIMCIEKYSDKFIEKIKENIYGTEDVSFPLNELEENGWTPGDVYYQITSKITLEEINP